MFTFKLWRTIAFLMAILGSLTLPFQNCGRMEAAPGNGQGYEGAKLPDDTIDQGDGNGESQIPTVFELVLDANTAPANSSPLATWAPIVNYDGFERYEAAIFDSASSLQVTAWVSTIEPRVQFIGLNLTPGSSYVIGVRVISPTGPGNTILSSPWTAF